MPGKSISAPTFSEDAVRTRAYFLWEADGGPVGRDEHYWSLALAEVAAAMKPGRAAAAGAEAAPARKLRPKTAAKPKTATKVTKTKPPVSKSKKKR